MSPRIWFRGVLAIFMFGSEFAVLAQTPTQPISTTYILSQAICLTPSPPPPAPYPSPPPKPRPEGCVPQTVPAGSMVEIQLPGNPSKWRASQVSPGLRLVSQRIFASPGRIPDTNEIYVFRYLLLPAKAGSERKETLVFIENPENLSKPVGKFTFTILRK